MKLNSNRLGAVGFTLNIETDFAVVFTPQLLAVLTDKLPATNNDESYLTKIDVSPCPDTIVAPVGTLHT